MRHISIGSSALLLIIVGILLVAAPGPVAAVELDDADGLQEAVRSQAARIETLEQRLRELEVELAQRSPPSDATTRPPVDEAPSADTTASAADRAAPQAPSAVSWKGAPELTSADGEYSMKVRGRMLADMWSVGGDPAERNYPSGTEVRSVRLGVEGRLGPVLSYKAEADFAGNSVTIKDAYLQYRSSSAWAVQAGNLKPHVSLENRIGLPQTTFMERALPNVFAISEEVLGLALVSHGRKWSLGAGAFGEGPGTHIEGNEGYGVAARFTYAPLLDDRRLLHLGVSGYHKYLGADAGADFRLRQRPESHLFATRLIDTGNVSADSTSVIGAELAGVGGPFSVQAEYLQNRVDYTDQATADFDGAYAFVSWLATGESRPYSVSSGKFGGVRPDRPLGGGGWGALEFAIRYSTLDLDDGPVQGGTGENITFGINWYPSEYARVAFNWVHFDVDDSAAALPFGVDSHDGNALGVRAQVIW